MNKLVMFNKKMMELNSFNYEGEMTREMINSIKASTFNGDLNSLCIMNDDKMVKEFSMLDVLNIVNS